jgi:hypothetical protein
VKEAVAKNDDNTGSSLGENNALLAEIKAKMDAKK